jgi:hypothetical protein
MEWVPIAVVVQVLVQGDQTIGVHQRHPVAHLGIHDQYLRTHGRYWLLTMHVWYDIRLPAHLIECVAGIDG